MCEPASMVVTKRKVYWSEKTDSHSEIIEEFKIRECGVGGEINVVPVEIIPPGGDYTLPLSKWKFKIDYCGFARELPDWAIDTKRLEKRCRIVLKDWAKANLVTKGKKIVMDYAVVAGNAFVELHGSSSAVLYDSSSAVLHGSSSAELYDSSSAVLYDSSSAVLCGSSSAVLWDSSSAVLRGPSSAELHGSSSAVLWDSSSAVLCGSSSALLWDSSSALLWNCANYKIKSDNGVIIDRRNDKVTTQVGRK